MNGSGKWRLRLLGGFGLSRDGQATEVALGRNERALLAYLVLHPHHRETRQKLATLLWGNVLEEAAKGSLNDCLYKLRRAHDDLERKATFASQGDYIVVDTTRFQIDAVDLIDLAKKADRDSLESAESLLAGELLDGLEVRTEEFEDWLRDERARFEKLAIDTRKSLMEKRQETGDIEGAADMAYRVLQMDAAREEAHRLLMRQHWQAGRWKDAFEQYRHCEAALKSSLDIEPSPETRQLLEEIRKAHHKSGDPANEPTPSDATPNPSLPIHRPQKKPHRPPRPHSIRRLIRALLATIAGLIFIVVAGMAYTVWYFWTIPELAPAPLGWVIQTIKDPIAPEPPRIVVLPFESTGDDSARADAYADAITDGISGALAKASEMFVIAQGSAAIYKGKSEPIPRIAKEQGVRYVLEGSLQKWGDRVVIQTALVDADKGAHIIWSDSFEGSAGDFKGLQNRITLDVITSLQVEITEGEKERINRAHGTDNLDAWLLAAEAYKLLRHLNPGDNRRARDLYLRAIGLDPTYAGAQEGLAWTHFIDARFGWSATPEQSIAEAVRLAESVRALDPTRARVYSLLGTISLLDRNYELAEELGEKAVRDEPNDADAAFLLGYTLTFSGKPQQAIGLVQRAIDRTPFAPGLYYIVLGRANRLAGFYRDASAILERVVAADDSSYIPYVELAATYAELGSTGKARAAAAEVLRRNPDFRIGDWVQRPVFKDDATTAHEVELLRSAGLPE